MTRIKKLIVPSVVGLAAFAGMAGGSIINTIGANAATSSTTGGGTSTSADSNDDKDHSTGRHVGSNGTKETLLTGDTATKAKAAAEAAVPGGTVQRVENDAEGAAYEAHVQKSDGSRVTVKMDASFKVTGTESGHGAKRTNDTN